MIDEQKLKLALAGMLPYKICNQHGEVHWWNENGTVGYRVCSTEWLHLCWLVEETLDDAQYELFCHSLSETEWDTPRWFKSTLPASMLRTSSSWQQRAQALCKVKGLSL